MKEQRDNNLNFGKHQSAEDPHVFSKEENMNLPSDLRSLVDEIRNTQPSPIKVNHPKGPKGALRNWRS